MNGRRSAKLAVSSLMLATLTLSVAAEDKLKPFVDQSFNTVKQADDRIAGLLYSLFPSLQESVARTIVSADKFLPFMKDFHWIYYLAGFIAIIAVLVKIWELGKKFLINSVVGVLLLLICIHVLGVELKVSLLTLLVTGILGVPGVLLILLLHYLGVNF
jgi:hypothetical protein